MKAPPLGPSGEHITWPDQVAARCRKASSTRNHKPRPSSPMWSFRSAGSVRLPSEADHNPTLAYYP